MLNTEQGGLFNVSCTCKLSGLYFYCCSSSYCMLYSILHTNIVPSILHRDLKRSSLFSSPPSDIVRCRFHGLAAGKCRGLLIRDHSSYGRSCIGGNLPDGFIFYHTHSANFQNARLAEQSAEILSRVTILMSVLPKKNEEYGSKEYWSVSARDYMHRTMTHTSFQQG